jgi:hypothetical protein
MSKSVTCKKCGRNDLAWKQSKAGKWYLTYDESCEVRGESGSVIKSFKPAHQCLQREGALESERAILILCGIITTTAEEYAEAVALEVK